MCNSEEKVGYSGSQEEVKSGQYTFIRRREGGGGTLETRRWGVVRPVQNNRRKRRGGWCLLEGVKTFRNVVQETRKWAPFFRVAK